MRQIVAGASVGWILADQGIVFLNALLIIVEQTEVRSFRAILLAIRHAINMAEGLFDVLFSIVILVHVCIRKSHAPICHREVFIERYYVGITFQGLIVVAV